jgi:hypothetical protein
MRNNEVPVVLKIRDHSKALVDAEVSVFTANPSEIRNL